VKSPVLLPSRAPTRRLRAFLTFALILLAGGVEAAAQVAAVRLWPGPEYTRLTIESDIPVTYKAFSISAPERLVLDLEGIEPGQALDDLPSKLASDDPFVASIRVGRFKPGVVRLVLDLKQPVNPQLFILKPVGEYGHRLVLDVYPTVPVDPILALLREQALAPAAPAPNAKPPVATTATMPAQPSQDMMRLITVAIDAGHGGEDPGAKGRRGTYEKHVTLSIARRIKALIDAEPGMRGVLIRDGDYFIKLADRVEKARKMQVDLFVSIHADAFTKPHARGSSVFTLSERGATSAMAAVLATKENEADLIGGVNIEVEDPLVKQVLIDLSQTVAINDSLKVARAVLVELGDVNELHRPHVEQAGFAVLKAHTFPSILVETAFLTNPEEELRLRDEKYQDKMAAAIFAGIKKYFAANPPSAKNRLVQY
jgi:N-acetylmuramoyl-L-alanine amidase